ncbi:MAG: lysophospholipid acyltransferase family protein [Phycisphaerae bacterium]|nr:lysophospholipid acyltransferase family protein [Phycisphaerae bacterium]
MRHSVKQPLIRLDVPSGFGPWKARAFRALRPSLARIFVLDRLNELLDRVLPRIHAGSEPLAALNDETGIHPLVSPQDLARIPRHGPLVVVSNHPFGLADPQALATLLFSVRPDVKFVANRLLGMVPHVGDSAFFVDVFRGPGAQARNVSALMEAMEWVEDGGCLAMFPAGEVAHLGWPPLRVRDGEWSGTAARVALRANAAVLPIRIDGRNGALFQMLGLVHPLLRTALLPREYLRAFGRGVRVRVGTPLTPAQAARFADADELTRFLRVRSDLLAARREESAGAGPRALSEHAPHAATVVGAREERGAASPGWAEPEEALPPQPVALVPQHSPAELAAEVSSLPQESLLLRQGDYEVHCARAHQLPLLMLEMGRLREIAFRAVGEGSGRSLDIDRFDRHYRQLFVWNARRQELVGAYRMGLTDEILDAQGIDGLYTSTLFEYSPRVLRQLGPSIELGRSYVRKEYQRKPLPLLLLWRGIAEFIGRHPRYVIVFGPVSISDEYLTMSKKLMMAFLETHRALTRFAQFVRPRNPPQIGSLHELDREHARCVIRDVDEVDQVVRELENGERAVPVLLRQYLRMNARLLAFNVDPDFGNVVDALMFADMREIHPRIQDFYLGREKAGAFRRFHGLDDRAREPRRRARGAR